jgi:TonB family protein
MKTKTHTSGPAKIRIISGLLVIAAAIALLSSCGKSTNKLTESVEIAPPPPPPPVPAEIDSAFTQVDEMPVFKGGDAGIVKFIKDSTRYPNEAKINNITGKVLIKFIVEKDGSVSGAEIAKGSNPLLDTEAVRVVSLLPKFEKPGKNNGEIVRVNYIIPITFALK